MLKVHLIRALTVLFLLMPSAHGAVDVTAREIHLDPTLRYVEDAAGTLDLDRIQQDDIPWQNNGSTAFNQGYHASAWWLHVRLVNGSDAPLRRLIEVGYAALDYVDIYVLDQGRITQSFQLGDKYPYDRRPIDHRFPIAPLNFAPGQTLDVYLRVQTSGALQVPLTLWEYTRFHSADFVSTMVQGIYFGGVSTIALYNLLIFLVLRDRNYLFYVVFIVSTMLAMAAQQGLAFRFLWPEATRWNDLAILFFTSCTGVFAILFTLRFLRVQSFAPALARVLQVVMLLGVVMMALCFVLDYRVNAILTLVNLIAAVSLAVVTGIIALIKRVPSAQIYLLAWTILLVGAGVISLSRLGMVQVNVVTEYAVQLGSLLEAILLSLALADRINTERRLRYQAQTEALQASQKANLELEARVRDRTAELEQLNRRLQHLSETDQLTGLANRRYLEQRLQQEWERASRNGSTLAFLLVDVDHFKQVNDRYGHPAGDACLQQVAKQISSGLRLSSDVAARYGGEEFCLLLPNTDCDGAKVVAERIRRSVENHVIEVDNAVIRVTISIGVSCCVPGSANSIEQLIKRADDTLYQSKQSGRNQVTVARLD